MTTNKPLHEPGTEAIGKATAAPPRLMTLILLSALAVLPVNMILPSLPNIAATFQADFALVNLSVAGFAIITALIEAIGGAISDRYGRRPVVLISLSIFIAASIGCVLAPNIAVFLFFRAMQACIAPCYSVALVVIKDEFRRGSGSEQIRLPCHEMGTCSDGWPFIWWFIGRIVRVAVELRCLCDPWGGGRHLVGTRIEGNSAAEIQKQISHLLCGASRFGQVLGVYPLDGLLDGGALCLPGRSAVGCRRCARGIECEARLLHGSDSHWVHTGQLSCGRFASQRSLRTVLVSARLITCIGLLVGLVLAMLGVTHILAFFGPCVFIGIGNGLTMAAANSGAMSVRSDLVGTAAGLAAAMRIAGGAIIASVAGLFLADSVQGLFILMLISALLALLTAVYAAVLGRRSPRSLS